MPIRRHNIRKWSESKKIAGTKKELHYWSCSHCQESNATDSKKQRDKQAAEHEQKITVNR